MQQSSPLRNLVSRVLNGRMLRRFHSDPETVAVLEPPAERLRPDGEWEAVAALVGPDSTVLNVGGPMPAGLCDAVTLRSQLRSVRQNQPLDGVLCGERTPVDLVNSVEGGRALRTLRGSGALMRRARPAWRIRIEGNPDDPAHSAHAAFLLLISRGYAAHVWDGGRLRPRGVGERAEWYFFLTQRHLRRLPGHLTATVACRAA